MTNFEKLIDEIKNMSIHDFAKRFYPCLGCKYCSPYIRNTPCNYHCSDNIEVHLKSEVEE